MKVNPLIVAPLILAVSVLTGCDSKIQYEHAKVHGRVTYKGKHVTFGSDMFVPVEPPKDGMMQPASGTISADGNYELNSEADQGAILGEHKVLVIAVEGDKVAEPEEAAKDNAAPAPSKTAGGVQFKSVVPKKYSDPTTTPLTQKVVAGDNIINLELTD